MAVYLYSVLYNEMETMMYRRYRVLNSGFEKFLNIPKEEIPNSGTNTLSEDKIFVENSAAWKAAPNVTQT
jgi:hypothetical protein